MARTKGMKASSKPTSGGGPKTTLFESLRGMNKPGKSGMVKVPRGAKSKKTKGSMGA